MKIQNLIPVLTLVLVTILTISCAKEDVLPAMEQTTLEHNVETVTLSVAFVVPEDIQQLPEEEIIAYLKSLTPEEIERLTEAYSNDIISERSNSCPIATAELVGFNAMAEQNIIEGYFVVTPQLGATDCILWTVYPLNSIF